MGKPVATLFGSLPVCDVSPEQPEPEPVAWWNKTKDAVSTDPYYKKDKDCIPLYTAPPQREFIELTNVEAYKLIEECTDPFELLSFTQDKLKEKNA